MPIKSDFAGLSVILAVFLVGVVPAFAQAQTSGDAALTGQISSQEEGPMEGVLVSASRANSNVTVTVVSDAKGRYDFPRARLAPGRYSLSVRAGGYEIISPGAAATTPRRTAQWEPGQHAAPLAVTAQVAAGGTTQLNFRLGKAGDPTLQLSDAEWLINSPGRLYEKRVASRCGACHSLERVARSKHNAAAMFDVIRRMKTYADGSTPLRPIKVAAGGADSQASGDDDADRRLAEYLSTVNLSSATRWGYPLWPLPRPKGLSTKVVYAEYNLPRAESQPREVAAASNGMVWYSDFGSLFLGRLDPRTGEVKEWSLPERKPGIAGGSSSLTIDKEGNVWLGSLAQSAIYKFDVKAEKFASWPIPGADGNNRERTSMIAPQHADVDGKVWFSDDLPSKLIHRLNLATGQIETFDPFGPDPSGNDPFGADPSGKDKANHSISCIASYAGNDLIFCDSTGSAVGTIEARTGKISRFDVPSPGAPLRQGNMDSLGRLWFGESRDNRIGMFNTENQEILEWRMVTSWSDPEDAMADGNGDAWIGGKLTDRVVRLTPSREIQFTTALGKRVEYVLPRPTQIRRVFVDSSSNRVTFWAGSSLGASIVRLEPLE